MAVAVAVGVAGSGVASGAPVGVPARPPPGLDGNVVPAVSPEPDGPAVVASGPAYDGAVPVVVANGSRRRVTGMAVRATARRPDGEVAARGVARDLVPSVLGRSGLAIGSVPLEGAPPDAVVSFRVEARRAERDERNASLAVTRSELGPPRAGPVAQRLTGRLRNSGDAPVGGPVSVTVMCFSEARAPVLTAHARLDVERVGPGRTHRFAVGLPELCPAYLVGARAV